VTAYTLITGATSGIGRDLALALAPEGPVLIHGRDAARAAETAKACSGIHPHQVWLANLEAPVAAATALIEGPLRKGLQIRTLIHCAGTAPIGPFRQANPGEVARTFATNVLSLLTLLQALAPGGANGEALTQVIILSSAAGRRGSRGSALYASTKGALDALVPSLAAEWAPGVRVNGILPGIVPTPMSQTTLDGEFFGDRPDRYPLGIGRVADVLAMARFLVSEEARWITGALYGVDGGHTAA